MMDPVYFGRQGWLPGDPPAWIPERIIQRIQQLDQETLDIMKAVDGMRDMDVFIHDNSSERQHSRKALDGSLMVWRPAYMIRPPDNFGAPHESPSDDLDLRINRRLNSSSHEQPHEHSDLRIDSEHKLCQACKDVFNYFCCWLSIEVEKNYKIRHPLPNIVVHHFDILSLRASSSGQCSMCLTLRTYVENNFPALTDLHPNAEKYRIEACWPKSGGLEGKRELYFILVDPSKPRSTWNFAQFYRMVIWPTRVFGHYFNLPTQLPQCPGSMTADGICNDRDLDDDGANDGKGREEDGEKRNNSRSGPNSRALARSWLHGCLADGDGKHTACNRKPSDFMPTRLLDVQSAEDTGSLRIINPVDDPDMFSEHKSWASLSYCWGLWGAQNNPSTKSSNLQERRMTGVLVSQLPLTFQDTLKVCKWLDIRWLWIDCLCIIQDSEEDWLQEASMLHEIYQNGIVNISANFGASPTEGLFSTHDPQDVPTIQFSSVALKQSWKVTPHEYHAFDWMDQMPSLSRVWIHRERQLARRILHFNHDQLVWECCGADGSAFANEMFPNGSPFKNLFGDSAKWQIGASQAEPNADKSYAAWNQICEDFSARGLTKPSDMPIILSSLAKEFSNLLPKDEYLAGLWRATMPHSLAWETMKYKREGMKEFAPSWSWMSVGSSVELRDISVRRLKPSLLKMQSVSLEPHRNGVFGDLECGYLHVRGFLRQLRISFGENNAIELGFVDGDAYQYLGPTRDSYHGSLGKISLDEPSTTDQLECYCLPVMLSKYSETDFRVIITCLLLQRDFSDVRNRFRRIGLAEFHSVYALRFRYLIASGYPAPEKSLWTALTEKIQCEDNTDAKEIQRRGNHTEITGKCEHNLEGDNDNDIGEGEESHDNASTGKESNNTARNTTRSEARKELKRDLAAENIVASLYRYDDLLPHLPALIKLEPQNLTLI